jgi:hypothetical protein
MIIQLTYSPTYYAAMAKHLLSGLLSEHLGKFVDGFSVENLQLGLWRGQLGTTYYFVRFDIDSQLIYSPFYRVQVFVT